MKKHVIAAGHICIDITPVFPEKPVSRIDQLLIPGSLVETGAADVHTGGSVANTGLALKYLGADVSLMGKIGNDAFGSMVLHILQEHDAAGDMLISQGESTSYSVVLAVPGLDRTFLHNPGANNTFGPEDIPETALQNAALFHFGYPPLMRRMYEHQGEELVTLLQRARDAGCATSLDMAAVDESSQAGQAPWRQILARILPLLDFFVPSVEELCYMLDPDRLKEWKQRANGGDVTEFLDPERDIRPLADICMELGAKVLLIKCGAPGMYYRCADRERLSQISPRLELNPDLWANCEGFQSSFIPDVVRSGTGAGDTSIAAFLTAMLEGCGAEECVQLAAATGSCCVTGYDALSGLQPLEVLRNRIRGGWKTYTR